MNQEVMKKNVPGWVPAANDYRLIFKEVNGLWIEVSNNLPEYAGKTFADFLSDKEIILDTDCIFARLRRDDFIYQIRDCGGFIRFDAQRITI